MTRSSFLLLVALSAAGVGQAVLGANNVLFKRGDANLDGALDLSDATYTLRFLFFGFTGRPQSLGCQDAADSNDDGTVDISDAVRTLGFLFLGTAPLPPPFGECGRDPSRDVLGCEAFPGCEQVPPGGEGRFGEPVNYPAYCLPTAVTLGDFNGDHALDLANTNWCGGASVRLGVVDGTFGEAVNYSLVTLSEIDHRTGFRPEAVATGDINADGVLDLATANSDSSPVSDVSILLGAGDGSFGEAASYPLNGRGAFSVALGDLNGDGALDVAAGLLGGGFSVSVLLGAGNGSFGEAIGYGVYSDGWSLALGDLDSDGALDLAVTDWVVGGVSILLGAGDGTLGKPVGYTAADSNPISVALGDLDRDGALDLAVANGAGASILLGDGDGTFGKPVICTAGKSPRSVSLGDIDGDGALDLAVVNQRSNDVSILLGIGDGTFGVAANYGVGDQPRSIALGDLNGDAKLDLVVTNFQSNDVSILLAR